MSLLEGFEVGERFRDRLKTGKSRDQLDRALREKQLADELAQRKAELGSRETEAVNRNMLERDLAKMNYGQRERDANDRAGQFDRELSFRERAHNAGEKLQREQFDYQRQQGAFGNANQIIDRSMRMKQMDAEIERMRNPRPSMDYTEDIENDEYGQPIRRSRRFIPAGQTPPAPASVGAGQTPVGVPPPGPRPGAAPQSPAPAIVDEMVNVVGPNGQPGRMPKKNLPAALQRGFRVAQ